MLKQLRNIYWVSSDPKVYYEQPTEEANHGLGLQPESAWCLTKPSKSSWVKAT